MLQELKANLELDKELMLLELENIMIRWKNKKYWDIKKNLGSKWRSRKGEKRKKKRKNLWQT